MNPPAFDTGRPIDLGGAAFSDYKYEWYRWMLDEAPVCKGRVSVVKLTLVSRYDDCRMVLGDERFIRNRGRAKGKGSSPFPIPIPKSVASLTQSMIVEDDPEHRRLRNLVNKAFTPRAVGLLSDRVQELTHELLDGFDKQGSFDLLESYSRPIPTRVIAEMIGLSKEDIGSFQNSLGVLTKGLSGFALARTLLWDLRKTSKFLSSTLR